MIGVLPNELIEVVIENVNDDDLPSIRLTNKRLNNMVTKRFTKTYFTELKVFMSRHSLQLLNEICAHPLFGAQVRTIKFASQRLLKAGLESAETSMLAAEENCRFLEATVDAAMEFSMNYTLAYEEQKSMAESGEGILLLTTALDKLSVFEQPVALGLVDGVWDHPEEGVLGSYTFGKDCFERYNSWGYWECVRSGTLKTLLTAAYRSKCRITSLSIKFENLAYRIPSNDEFAEQEDPDMGTIDLVEGFDDFILANVAQDLHTFELKLLNSFHDWEGATPISTARILENATNLKVLHVDVGGASYSDFARGLTELSHWEELEVLTAALSTTSLEEVHLSNCMIPQSDLIDLITRNRSNFRALEVVNCCIGWEGSWSGLLSWIVDNDIQLDRLVLTDLYREERRDRYYPVDFIVAGTTEYEGDRLQQDLQHFVSELRASGF